MTTLRQVTSEVELKEIIAAQGLQLLEEVKSELGDLEAEYKNARKQSSKGIIFLILGFLSLSLSESLPSLLFTAFTFMAAAITGMLFVYHGLKHILLSQYIISQFDRTVDGIIFSKVFDLLHVSGSTFEKPALINATNIFAVTDLKSLSASIRNLIEVLKSKKATVIEEEVFAQLATSELITESHNQNQIDTGMKIQMGDAAVTVAEFDIEHVTGSGKNKSTKQIFHGYFASVELGKELSGKTFVSTEGDTHGFGRITFWNKNATNIPTETVLEWNDFENMLHVATTDETEARYILTPDFMQDLYEWWKEQKTNIRIAFIKNRLYVLFPDEKIRIGSGINADLTEESIVDYVYTIARPLWHIARLIDKVRV